jgi:hypothetical protein
VAMVTKFAIAVASRDVKSVIIVSPKLGDVLASGVLL